MNVYYSHSNLFCSFEVSLSALHQLQRFSHLQQSTVPLQLLLSSVVITMNVRSSHRAFYFHGHGLPLSFSGT